VSSRRRNPPEWLALLDLAPLLWLCLLFLAYLLLALHPLVPTRAPVPGIAELEAYALPLLAVTVAVGIIRWLVLRGVEAGADRPRPAHKRGSRDRQ
jgi:hypothetical protein